MPELFFMNLQNLAKICHWESVHHELNFTIAKYLVI